VKPTNHDLNRRRFLASASLAALASPALLARPAWAASRNSGHEVFVDDPDGVLGLTQSPVAMRLELTAKLREIARQGRLQLRELQAPSAAPPEPVPVQVVPSVPEPRSSSPLTSSALAEPAPVPAPSHAVSGQDVRAPGQNATSLCWLMPPGPKGRRTFRLEESRNRPPQALAASQESASGQFDLKEAGQKVLRYNYATIEPGELLKSIAPGNLIYARARSDYIHPLFGLNGEALTRDWSKDHPHHRGIYWAWPEVDWRGQRGDLHALQKVFARPTGHCVTTSGAVFAQIAAVNLWKWEDLNPIVRENTTIRAYRATPQGRLIDLEFTFEALGDPVLLARRGTDKYGGLNIRLATVKDQKILTHTDPPEASPRRLGGGVRHLQRRARPGRPGGDPASGQPLLSG
jgi:hypothetical protein